METDGSRKFGHDMKVNTPREQNIKYNSGNEFLMCPIDVWEMESQSPITFTQFSFSAAVRTLLRPGIVMGSLN